MRQLHLQDALFRSGAVAENFQNQGGAVDHLAVPQLFQIALLNRRQGAVHHRQRDFVFLYRRTDAFSRAFAQIQRRVDLIQNDGFGANDVQIDRRRQIFDLLQPRLNRTPRVGTVFQNGVQDESLFGQTERLYSEIVSGSTSSSSNRETGTDGMIVDTACLYTSWV